MFLEVRLAPRPEVSPGAPEVPRSGLVWSGRLGECRGFAGRVGLSGLTAGVTLATKFSGTSVAGVRAIGEDPDCRDPDPEDMLETRDVDDGRIRRRTP